VRFADDDDEAGERFACLGVVPFSLDTHDEGDGWSELRSLARLASRSAEKTVYGIPAGGCAAYEGGALRAIGKPLVRFASGRAARRLADLAP
jgi:hypothetical protein